jgi:hypothetical protein
VNYWGIIIGGTAIAGALIAIAKGYRYLWVTEVMYII